MQKQAGARRDEHDNLNDRYDKMWFRRGIGACSTASTAFQPFWALPQAFPVCEMAIAALLNQFCRPVDNEFHFLVVSRFGEFHSRVMPVLIGSHKTLKALIAKNGPYFLNFLFGDFFVIDEGSCGLTDGLVLTSPDPRLENSHIMLQVDHDCQQRQRILSGLSDLEGNAGALCQVNHFVVVIRIAIGSTTRYEAEDQYNKTCSAEPFHMIPYFIMASLFKSCNIFDEGML